jgi:hypothetical protein
MTDAARHVDDNVVFESHRPRVTGGPLYVAAIGEFAWPGLWFS